MSGAIDSTGTVTVQQKESAFTSCPICLSADTLIDTPNGPTPVTQLRAGMQVWTMDRSGVRVAAPLIRVSQTFVPTSHHVIHLKLSDERELWASAGHPTADGRTLAELETGNILDGSTVIFVEHIPYQGNATYDLLPEGDTGFYWANGILLASTLTPSLEALTNLP